MLIALISGVLIGISAYLIIADIFHIPTIKTSKVINNIRKNQSEGTGSIDIWLDNLSSFIASKLRLNEFKKGKLESDLKTAQMDISAEMYIAKAIVKSLLVLVLAIPAGLIFPVSVPVVILLSFILFRMNVKNVSLRIKRKREKIENDLPRLVATIEKTLKHERNITNILREFSKNANNEMKHELDITLADIHSGNEEAAISRLEARVGSPMMSDVCRGLITLIHGDSASVYWQGLSIKFSEIGRQRLKARAEKIPKKVKRLSMCLLICFLFIYVVVIISQIMNSVGLMFG